MTIASISSAYSQLQVSALSTTSAASTASTARTTPTPATARPAVPEAPGHISAAAEVLGLSTDEITEALAGGSSLADLAQEQGVSRDDLISALVADAPADMQALDNVEAMIGSMVDQTGLGGPGGGPPPANSSGVLGDSMTATQQDTIDALSELIEVEPSELLAQLRSGTSLADLISGAGLDVNDLAGAVEDGLLLDATA
ncbi:hypothetical protein [Pengzhenrongella sicca]|uniref:Uncharacterized protein n=1 Tax=Pengzhenrongella sicca TaxID=2819238 RepID=A0A8A4ZED2_9MICO|nr:hypothetical protein [Pengzhenrongella sicca]QTE29263.1 hypothetical protein J4E96_18620 [Pengzhenrongella sicca]